MSIEVHVFPSEFQETIKRAELWKFVLPPVLSRSSFDFLGEDKEKILAALNEKHVIEDKGAEIVNLTNLNKDSFKILLEIVSSRSKNFDPLSEILGLGVRSISGIMRGLDTEYF